MLSSNRLLTDSERPTRTIARTLNARYQVDPYGLGPDSAATTYPVSTFVTHLVYLRGCAVRVDVSATSVRLSRLSPVGSGLLAHFLHNQTDRNLGSNVSRWRVIQEGRMGFLSTMRCAPKRRWTWCSGPSSPCHAWAPLERRRANER